MRSTPRSGVLRWLRVGFLGASSAALGVGAHLIGGGVLPGRGVLAVLVAVLGMVAVAATERRVRFPALVAILAVEQLALHTVLALAAHAPAVAGGTHAAHGVTVGSALGETGSMITTPTMLVGHVLATVLTAWLLARGEAWLWHLAAQLVAVVGGPRRRPRGRVSGVAVRPVLLLTTALHRSTPRRGPPYVFAAA